MNVSLEEYFKTAFEDKLLVKMPEREDDQLTTATRLLEKRREMQEIDQALAAQKEEFQMKMESLQQRREELERKEYQLKESLLKFDKFLKENDAKRARALKKMMDERDTQKQKNSEIEKITQNIDMCTQIRDKLLARLNRYVVSQRYLESVIEKSEDLSEIREVVDRYATLTATQKDLIARDKKNQAHIEQQKQDLYAYKLEKESAKLSHTNNIVLLQKDADRAQSKARRLESEWIQLRNQAAKSTLELGCIRIATYNLHQLVSRYQRQMEEVALEDTEGQLTVIQTFIQDLSQVTNSITSGDQDAANGADADS